VPRSLHRREVHYWSEELLEPPCATLEERFEWSNAIEDVTCPGCREALAGDGGDLRVAEDEDELEPGDERPSP
jgi:hypothetical protein